MSSMSHMEKQALWPLLLAGLGIGGGLSGYKGYLDGKRNAKADQKLWAARQRVDSRQPREPGEPSYRKGNYQPPIQHPSDYGQDSTSTRPDFSRTPMWTQQFSPDRSVDE